ncbi:cGMP-dependent protein kinase, isozyme 1 isoform X2 [Toxorhynchites rutilus septentrionalis]|uniref:cGMP-dependent protein kinase, isozyme 1 isoform X2 n=1 Tax=Toxorhynchites rutilus septentrionalis TaxID=329112 RepID=UPI00247ABCB3|nr:cGMP-dependent protein kinase, isozyme 1 isoform X2 [Toxorhynchites rutilus septentrionalis]
MEMIKKENIQISDNGGPTEVTTGPPAATTAATPALTQATTAAMATIEVRDEKSQNEKSVHSEAQPSKQPSNTGLRALFRKSNTCGSLYVKCSCSNSDPVWSHALTSEGVHTGSGGGSLQGRHSHAHSRPISTSEKDFRRIKVLHAFSHPDTTTVFTDENKYANNFGNSPTRALITSAQAGQFELLHSTHSKRLSSPTIHPDYAFHPEFVLQKLALSRNGQLQDKKSSSINIPRKPILKKSSKSYPGLSPSDNSVELILRSFARTHFPSSSVDEVTEEESVPNLQVSESDDNDSGGDSLISFSAKPDPTGDPSSEFEPEHACVINGDESSINNGQDALLARTYEGTSCGSVIQSERSKRSDPIPINRAIVDSSDHLSDSVCDSSPSVKVIGGETVSRGPIAPKLDISAQEFFIQSGILGPMGNGSSMLMRKTSKIVPNLDAPVKERIRKNSKLLYGKRTVLTDGRRKSIPPASNCDSFQSYGSTPTLAGSEPGSKTIEDEIKVLRQLLIARDEEISKLKREIDKLKSVLQQTTVTSMNRSPPGGSTQTPNSKVPRVLEGDLLSSIQTNYVMAGQQLPMSELYGISGKGFKLAHNSNGTTSNGSFNNKGATLMAMKKQGVSGESCELMGSHSDIKIPKYDKDYSSKQLIKDAILENDFFKNIDSLQIREIVDSMYSREFRSGEYVIHEGQAGSHLYVSAVGEFEVLKDGKSLGFMGSGKAFGELAILYNCTRTASIRALNDSRVWVLDRRVFQQIMMRTGMQRIEENVNFLRSVPLLKNLSNDVLTKIADVLEVEFYPVGAYIIRQGEAGDTFFLISQGTVKVTQRFPGRSAEEEIRILGRGEYFGEKALIKEDKRTANIIAMSPGVECLTLDRESFTKHIGDLCELHQKDYGDEERVSAFRSLANKPPAALDAAKQELMDVEFSQLETVGTLGVGGFGRVELVKLERNGVVQVYALKCMKKKHIVDTRQQEHVYSERKIMLACLSPFICRLYRTYRDDKYVYMLLEACMGGEVWTILRDRTHFDDGTAKFIVGCVLKAFEFLHARGIVYRDLKPENLLLDSKGYVKLVDFGFAKFIGYSSKTWTFCGTPEYVAPEIVLNRGHDRSVDYWALGVLIHELLTGIPPFAAADPMKTYNIILKGIDMVNFPKHMSRSAVSLIKRLCRDIPSERLGYQRGGVQDIKKHKWFQGFDWEGLANLTLKSPLQPKLKGPLDMSNFDVFPPDTSVPRDETSGWDADF